MSRAPEHPSGILVARWGTASPADVRRIAQLMFSLERPSWRDRLWMWLRFRYEAWR